MKFAFFDFHGRMARLPYFGYSLLAALFLFISIMVGILVVAGGDGAGVGVLLGGLVVLVGFGFGLTASVAITIKRLHDIGLTGLHCIWIYMISLAGGAFPSDSVMGVLANVAAIGVGLWLLFAPGQKADNDYGPAPK